MMDFQMPILFLEGEDQKSVYANSLCFFDVRKLMNLCLQLVSQHPTKLIFLSFKCGLRKVDWMKFPDTKKVFSIKTKEENFDVAKFLNGDENHKLIIYGIWTLNQLAPKLRPIFPLHKRNFVY